jgi:hypothetical protein
MGIGLVYRNDDRLLFHVVFRDDDMQRPVAAQSKYEPTRVWNIFRIVFHNFTRFQHVPDVAFGDPPLEHAPDGMNPEHELVRHSLHYTPDFTRIRSKRKALGHAYARVSYDKILLEIAV